MSSRCTQPFFCAQHKALGMSSAQGSHGAPARRDTQPSPACIEPIVRRRQSSGTDALGIGRQKVSRTAGGVVGIAHRGAGAGWLGLLRLMLLMTSPSGRSPLACRAAAAGVARAANQYGKECRCSQQKDGTSHFRCFLSHAWARRSHGTAAFQLGTAPPRGSRRQVLKAPPGETASRPDQGSASPTRESGRDPLVNIGQYIR
jgi:hypothetical protein